MEEDWDLQAVVRGCKAEGEPSSSSASRDLFSFPTTSLHLQEQEDDLLLYFPDLSSSKTVLQELHELCEPFLRRRPQAPSPSPPPPQQQPQPQARSPPQPPRSKRRHAGIYPTPNFLPLDSLTQHYSFDTGKIGTFRKNQQKKVVCQVPADGVSADMWAWRKYGQKPIKGSPFPRGYYRCSSSKGCPARKQVERSRTDPTTFVVTYTAEHNHPIPTHRNSLAGSTRHKATTTTTTTTTTVPKSNVGSPTTQLCSPNEEKKEVEEEEEEDEDGLLFGGDVSELLDDDALMTFGDFDDDRGSPEGFSTVFSSTPWPTTAAAGSG